MKQDGVLVEAAEDDFVFGEQLLKAGESVAFPFGSFLFAAGEIGYFRAEELHGIGYHSA